MTKGDAAGVLAALLILALLLLWFLSLLYAEEHSVLGKIANALTAIIIAAGGLTIVGLAIYCIYVLIA